MEKREYTDVGLLSKDSGLYVYDTTLSKYIMLIPVSDMPATKDAPAEVAKTVLTDHIVTNVQGLATNSQKTYTFNYHRDNLTRLALYVDRELQLLEINPDFTGEKFTGKLTFNRSQVSVNGIVQGQLFATVSSSDAAPVKDVRDIIANTAILTTPLNDVELATTTGTHAITLTGVPSTATFAAVSSATGVCTVAIATGVLTVTGVAAGNAIITITTSKTGEASSVRSFLVTVPAAA